MIPKKSVSSHRRLPNSRIQPRLGLGDEGRLVGVVFQRSMSLISLMSLMLLILIGSTTVADMGVSLTSFTFTTTLCHARFLRKPVRLGLLPNTRRAPSLDGVSPPFLLSFPFPFPLRKMG